MSEQQKLLIDATADMSENELKEVLLFAKYIKFRADVVKVPENLMAKDEEDLASKLNEGLEDIKNGKVYSFDEVYNQAKAILEG